MQSDSAGQGLRTARYQGQAAEKQALAALTSVWDFWSLPEMLATLSSPHSLLLYATRGEAGDAGLAAPSPPWQAALLVQWSAPLVDVVYLYTAPAARGQGIGLALLEHLWRLMQAADDLDSLLLEVRPSNTAARRLYEKFGMVEFNRRKAYYDDGEDALIYRRSL